MRVSVLCTHTHTHIFSRIVESACGFGIVLPVLACALFFTTPPSRCPAQTNWEITINRGPDAPFSTIPIVGHTYVIDYSGWPGEPDWQPQMHAWYLRGECVEPPTAWINASSLKSFNWAMSKTGSHGWKLEASSQTPPRGPESVQKSFLVRSPDASNVNLVPMQNIPGQNLGPNVKFTVAVNVDVTAAGHKIGSALSNKRFEYKRKLRWWYQETWGGWSTDWIDDTTNLQNGHYQRSFDLIIPTIQFDAIDTDPPQDGFIYEREEEYRIRIDDCTGAPVYYNIGTHYWRFSKTQGPPQRKGNWDGN